MSWKVPKTVLGNKIEWDLSKIPGTKTKRGSWSGKDDQLWRCRKTKKFEASLLNNIPHGACFVDAGAHFGDTIITMALYARDTLKRHDLHFVAFEPNPTKARFIEECAVANGFDSDTLKVISCVLGDETSVGGAKARREEGRDWCRYDGRTSYCKVHHGDGDGSDPSNSNATNQISATTDNDNGNDGSDQSSCSSSSDSSSSTDDVTLDMHRLDDYFDMIHPIGFLHIDVEGWEAKVLSGASKLLTAVTNIGNDGYAQCYILAETFNHKEARRRGEGFSQTHEEDILDAMKQFSFSRGEDVVDGERNMFFQRIKG